MQRPQEVHYRMYLLAYDLDKEDLYDRTRTAFLVRAGVLTELAVRGYVVDSDGDVDVAKAEPAGDRPLDEALAQIAEHDRSWKSWLRHDYKQTLDTVETHLQTTNLLSVAATPVLGLISRRHVTVTHPALVKELQDEARAILHGSQPSSEIDPADAAVVALAAAGRVPVVVSRKDSREYKDRIDALTSRVGAIAPGLEKAFEGIRTTMIAAQGGMGGG
jgi:Golgi phosphoprotein 3 (GPP34)